MSEAQAGRPNEIAEMRADIHALGQASSRMEQAISELVRFMHQNETMREEMREERKERGELEDRITSVEKRIERITGIGIALGGLLGIVLFVIEFLS